jgi:hypothetical protein
VCPTSRVRAIIGTLSPMSYTPLLLFA